MSSERAYPTGYTSDSPEAIGLCHELALMWDLIRDMTVEMAKRSRQLLAAQLRARRAAIKLREVTDSLDGLYTGPEA